VFAFTLFISYFFLDVTRSFLTTSGSGILEGDTSSPFRSLVKASASCFKLASIAVISSIESSISFSVDSFTSPFNASSSFALVLPRIYLYVFTTPSNAPPINIPSPALRSLLENESASSSIANASVIGFFKKG